MINSNNYRIPEENVRKHNNDYPASVNRSRDNSACSQSANDSRQSISNRMSSGQTLEPVTENETRSLSQKAIDDQQTERNDNERPGHHYFRQISRPIEDTNMFAPSADEMSIFNNNTFGNKS